MGESGGGRGWLNCLQGIQCLRSQVRHPNPILSLRPPPPPKKKKWRERALRQQTYILLFIVLIHYNIVANTPWDAEPRFANDFESVLRMIGTLGFPKSR